MSETLFVLGREVGLSLAELEAIGSEAKVTITPLSTEIALWQSDYALEPSLLKRLGGSQKMIKVLDLLPSKGNIMTSVEERCTANWVMEQVPTGRVEFGLSFYGLNPRLIAKIQRHFFQLKSEIRAAGRSVRLVTSREPHLSAVTVVRQGLLKHGKEFVFAAAPDSMRLGVTIAVQDYQGYGLRDFGRPAADPKSGMLPPKLAQIMLNLARVKPEDVVLDPFCGSGTVLQEAALLGVHEIHGSDTSDRAVKDAQENLRWLLKEYPRLQTTIEITKRDVRDQSVHPTVIVTEPFLGRPLRGHESSMVLRDQIRQLEQLYADAFRHWSKILQPDGRVTMIWPEFTIGGKGVQLNLEDVAGGFGFQRQPLLSQPLADQVNLGDRFVLRYGRPGARVRRQIRVWVRP